MKKKIVALILILTCVFSIASCNRIPAHDSDSLEEILTSCGYAFVYEHSDAREGMTGYYYAEKAETGDYLYYIYCKNIESANSIYEYEKSKNKAKIAELELEIDKVENVLYKSEGVSAEEKGKYYQKYVELSEALEVVKNYKCGRYMNVVWHGTKQAISDIKL